MSKSKSKSLSKKAMTDELMMVAKVAGGFVTGTVIVNAAEKALKVDSSSKFPKRLMAPLGVAAVGAIGSIKGHNPTIKQIAAGIGAAGAVRTAKAMAPNATMLQGLGEPEDEHLGLTPTSAISQNEDWVYRDSSGHLAFPELGEVQAPQSNNGYFVDAPAYLGESRDDAGMLGIEDAQIL
ncbi:MAG: hypothetical protein JST06_09025 [Bacteroidetes bacterium]|nr:hypothetical protein [Bacteroidota bacterium]MBS1629325.1 hypothetical protein [Bacteroidota bacterium]